MTEGDLMSPIGRDELDAVAMAHRAYCYGVPGMSWTRLADGEYEAIVRAAEPRGAVSRLDAIERHIASLERSPDVRDKDRAVVLRRVLLNAGGGGRATTTTLEQRDAHATNVGAAATSRKAPGRAAT